jgi:dolichol-phosphate mannosyltransferase
MKLTVIAPVYNEEEVIETFHARLSKVFTSLDGVDSRVLYVIDRCTDNTLEVVHAMAKNDMRVNVLALSSRFGHQMSLVAGIDNSLDSDVIVMMDSDLQHPPELIADMIKCYDEGHDIIYTIRRDTEEVNTFRKLAGNLFYQLLSNLSSISVNANAADFRLISVKVAKILSNGFNERNLFLRGIFPFIGFSQSSIEFVAGKRGAGRSKYSFSKILNLATSGIVSFSTKPLKLGIIIGVCFSLLSFSIAIWTLIEFFIDSTIPNGWTTLVVLLLLFSGIQLIILGILGTYIGEIFEEVKARPRYIVDEALSIRRSIIS